MTILRVIAVPFCALMAASSQSSKVDFAQDVQPIFTANCVSCHGAKKQNGGLRMDVKSSATKSIDRRVVPGSSENSFMYFRVSGNEYGPQMPPTGELKPKEIATIKAWIDQGAEWPDAMANEAPLPPLNPTAVAMVDALHNNDVAGFMKMAKADPTMLNARGPEGSTPFMYAVLYLGPMTLTRLLAMGADPNRANDAKVTALMWGAKDVAKTRLLQAHGAEVNARTDEHRTALMVAARVPGNAATVALLLAHGANVNPNAHPEQESSPLLDALTAGDTASVKLLLAHGADAKAVGETGLSMSVFTDCAGCMELLAEKITDKAVYTSSLEDIALTGNMKAVRLMLDHGADVKGVDNFGRTALMYAVQSDALPVDEVKLLMERGADVNAVCKHTKAGDAGLTVLDIAKRHGDTPIVALLVKAGAKNGPAEHATLVSLNPKERGFLRDAVQDSLPLLQKGDVGFNSSGCVSCHSNSLTAMTMSAARAHGFHLDEGVAAGQVKVNVKGLEVSRERMHLGYLLTTGDFFSENILAFMLMGLSAEKYPGDLNTDAAAMEILSRQRPTGEWQYPVADSRQPLCLDYIGNTALSMRSLQLYPVKAEAATYRAAVAKAGAWLATAHSLNNEDKTWRLTGLGWLGTNPAATARARQELMEAQKADGGWSDLPSMESNAYATGKSLVALKIGGLAVTDPAYRRGVKWLTSHQQADGTWYVQTRAMAFQPFFESGFPHGHNQWISAAGTNWAAMALIMAPDDGKKSKSAAGRE